ncbi:MAG: efflux RND transporter periplasmic adaptor subunit [Rhizobiaceae bacterium]|nr:efflux RND transporter periplasmic adaptor subunit [Rhizobiaceae bacterium]
MAAWKQLVLALVILVAAGFLWLTFVPGARTTLANLGIGSAPVENSEAKGNPSGGAAAGQRVSEVVVGPVTRATINDRLSAIGTGQAKASVVVNPFVSGRIVEIGVQPGNKVDVGTVLANLDADSEKIVLDRANLAVEDATTKLERVRALRTSNTATAVQYADAEVVLSNAKLEQRDAELALERRSIRSPIAGIVGILPIEIGDYVTNQTPIATVDDRTQIKIDFWVPERFASQIKVGQPVSASSVAKPGDMLQGTITAVDNRLDQASRTMQVQASVPNDSDTLRAGMSFQVTMKFPGDTYPAVDPLAIQWGSDGAFVWVVRDGKGERVAVRIVQRNTESVLVQGDLTEGEVVVTQGVHLVRPGGALRVAGRDASAVGAIPVATGG